MPDARLLVRPMRPTDWPVVREIYALGIAAGQATFEAEPPESRDAFAAHRMLEHSYVAEEGGDAVVGWVAVAPVSARAAYAGVVEHSVYVHPRMQGRGVGRLLLAELIRSTEGAGIWTIQSGIFPENLASRAVHRGAGFRELGTRRAPARMPVGPYAGQWRDVILVERRSETVGR